MLNRRRTNWKADLKWFLAFAALAQVGLILTADLWSPQLYDPEYGLRLHLLHQRMAEAPDRPVALVVGSSRIGLGFLPERLPPLRSADGHIAVPFNFAHLASGPVCNLVNLRRALRDGVKPRWLVLELNSLCLQHEGDAMPITFSSARDLPLLMEYFKPAKVCGVYLRVRLNPYYSWRVRILRQCAPCLATDAGGEDHMELGPLGGDDGWLLLDHIDPEVQRLRTDQTRAIDYPVLQDYRVDPSVDRAVRETLDLCRHEGIECALVITPESAEFRSWYSREGLERFDRYWNGLREEYDVPVIDARTWVPDDQFTDGHHPMRAGAEQFTDRLGREGLAPLVEGRLRGR